MVLALPKREVFCVDRRRAASTFGSLLFWPPHPWRARVVNVVDQAKSNQSTRWTGLVNEVDRHLLKKQLKKPG